MISLLNAHRQASSQISCCQSDPTPLTNRRSSGGVLPRTFLRRLSECLHFEQRKILAKHLRSCSKSLREHPSYVSTTEHFSFLAILSSEQILCLERLRLTCPRRVNVEPEPVSSRVRIFLSGPSALQSSFIHHAHHSTPSKASNRCQTCGQSITTTAPNAYRAGDS